MPHESAGIRENSRKTNALPLTGLPGLNQGLEHGAEDWVGAEFGQVVNGWRWHRGWFGLSVQPLVQVIDKQRLEASARFRQPHLRPAMKLGRKNYSDFFIFGINHLMVIASFAPCLN
jgi:hypothetical protein